MRCGDDCASSRSFSTTICGVRRDGETIRLAPCASRCSSAWQVLAMSSGPKVKRLFGPPIRQVTRGCGSVDRRGSRTSPVSSTAEMPFARSPWGWGAVSVLTILGPLKLSCRGAQIRSKALRLVRGSPRKTVKMRPPDLRLSFLKAGTVSRADAMAISGHG